MADHLNALPHGYRLDGYEVREVLSIRRYGIKYIATNREDGSAVAIKEYFPEGLAVRQNGTQVLPKSTNEKAKFDAGLARFLESARAHARIHHAHLVRTHRWLNANGTAYVVMDFVEGATLSAELARQRTLPERALLQIARPVLDALEKVHDLGFLHQDIRPGNIILRPDATPLLLELGAGRRTLGAARQAFERKGGDIALLAPVPGYAALEQYSNRSRLGPWTDIYAFGAVLYHCVAGQPPADAPSRVVSNEYVPVARAAKGAYGERLLGAIEAALAMPATARPSSIGAWRARFAATGSTARRRAGPSAPRMAARGGARPAGKSGSAPGRRRGRWVVPAVAALAIVAFLTWLDIGVLPDAKPAPPPPPPAAAAAAVLSVVTMPPGAEVLVDETLVGETPLTLDDLAAKEYAVSLRHPLYETVEVPALALSADAPTRLERTLVRASGSLEVITTPPGAWIERDGERWPRPTPTTLTDLPSGALTLVVGAEGYEPREVAAQVPKNETGTVRVELASNIVYGTLTLTLEPAEASVTLPDVTETYRPGVRLPNGEYRVQAASPGYLPETRVVTVTGDTAATFALTADPQPFTVAVTPPEAEVRFVASPVRYAPGVRLPPGEYRVRAVLVGHQTWEGTIAHGTEPTRHEVALPVGVAEFADALAGGGAGPTMVLVPAGTFRMGCVSGVRCRPDEAPIAEVTFSAPFALAKYEVTFEQFAAFTNATNRAQAQPPRGWSRTNRPVVNVSWADANAYAAWLSATTNRRYRLPSEAEWEYAARASATTAYSWGNEVQGGRANCNGCGSRWDNDRAAPVGFFPANPWGLHDMHGNVWEWVMDCRNDDLAGAPANGAARTSGDCLRRMLRGGSWSDRPEALRSARREWDESALTVPEIGFRVAAAASARE